MKKIGLFEAQKNLSEIADRVKRTGEPVTITRRGEPLVDVVRHREDPARQRSQADVLAELDELRLELPKSGISRIRADIREGRR